MRDAEEDALLYESALREIANEHRPFVDEQGNERGCLTCSLAPWPCSTMRIIRAALPTGVRAGAR